MASVEGLKFLLIKVLDMILAIDELAVSNWYLLKRFIPLILNGVTFIKVESVIEERFFFWH